MKPFRRHPAHPPVLQRDQLPVIVLVTVCTQDRKRLLAREEIATLLQAAWLEATTWRVGRFVIMPDHLHLFCMPAEFPARGLVQWVRYWKSIVSRRWPRLEEKPVWQLDFWDTQLRDHHHYDEKWSYV